MVNKGGFSFVAMLVINPIVILFYQNCSMAPLSYAKNPPAPATIQRGIASEDKTLTHAGGKYNCSEQQSKDCLRAE
jgi:hypothetical protein